MKKQLLILSIGAMLTSCSWVGHRHSVQTFLYNEIMCEYEESVLPYSWREIEFEDDLSGEWYTKLGVKSVYEYEISVYRDYQLDVWLCGACFNSYHSKDSNGYAMYNEDELVYIDCDLMYSIEYGTEIGDVE